jgi:hypothetical protein
MTKDQRAALCDLMRRYTRLRLDYFHLMGLMVEAKYAGKVPLDFLDQLNLLRQSPESRAHIEETEELLSHVLRTVDEDFTESDSCKDVRTRSSELNFGMAVSELQSTA